jgi:triacylglycerol lipase
MNIVLAHGILGFSHLDVPLLPLDYFAGLAEFLRNRFQASVITPAVDPTAGIETRSGMLRASIEAALISGQLQSNEPVHIIAHSMGGLDSRRMISTNPFIEAKGKRIAIQTLATIGTTSGLAHRRSGRFEIPRENPVTRASSATVRNCLEPASRTFPDLARWSPRPYQ